MADIAEVFPSKIICGILYNKQLSLDPILEQLTQLWGEIEHQSTPYCFSNGSSYYEKEMGSPLERLFISFNQLVSPETLAQQKIQTQDIEKKWAQSLGVTRPVNLDPGHITRGRLILSTTKDFSHRIYLHSGIYAEVTLQFKKHKVVSFPWTYPDIASGHWDKDFLTMKDHYQRQIEKGF